VPTPGVDLDSHHAEEEGEGEHGGGAAEEGAEGGEEKSQSKVAEEGADGAKPEKARLPCASRAGGRGVRCTSKGVEGGSVQ